jgi:hypothetical protein
MKKQTIKQRKRLLRKLITRLEQFYAEYPAEEDCDHQMDLFDALERFQQEMHG